MASPGERHVFSFSLACRRLLRRYGGLTVLLTCIAAFYAVTIREGNTWADDFALYIRHAENIYSGKAYFDTGYVYNPAVPIYGPPTYPPVFPLMLVPVYHFAGLDFWAMKCEQVGFFVLALLVIYLCFLDYTTPAASLLVVGLVGFNPNFWIAKDNILSDLPFLFFFWLAALLVLRSSRTCGSAALLGIVLYLAVGTRILGLTLLAGFVLHEVLQPRKLAAFTFIPAAICVTLFVAQTRMMAMAQGSSWDLFHPTAFSVISNLFAYARALATFWMGASKTTFAFLLVAITSALAAVGLYSHIKRRFAFLEITLALYLAAVIIWPGRPGLRLLYPVIPFYVYLVVGGLSCLTAYFSTERARTLAIAAILLLMGTGYVNTYRKVNWGIIAETDGLTSFNDLCRRLQLITYADDVFVCRRPRALTLFARRRAAVYDTGPDAAWWRFAAKIHASYLICNRQEKQDAEFLLPLVARSRSNLDLLYQNGDFELYRIRSYDIALAEPDQRSVRPMP